MIAEIGRLLPLRVARQYSLADYGRLAFIKSLEKAKTVLSSKLVLRVKYRSGDFRTESNPSDY